ncbi:MAG: FAD-dependent oxidoreductase [Rhizobiaceae bacterium]
MFGIIGGSVAGLFTARALARKGWKVTVIEPDAAGGTADADRTFDEWQRPGVPQLRQPHSIRAQARRLLLDRDPEMAADILGSGVLEWTYRLKRPGVEMVTDDELVGILGRRTTYEPAIRRRVELTPGVTFIRAAISGLLLDTGDRPKVTGVRLRDGRELEFDCVVDASGRRTRLPDWLREAGIEPPAEEVQEAGMIYYSRFFRFLPGVRVSQGDGLRSGPAGNLPLVSFRSNTTDRNTFSLLTAVASWEPRFRSLRDDGVFNAFAGRLPGVAGWIDPAVSQPISKVHAFGGIYDRYWEFLREGRPIVRDLYSVGDSRVHTSPYFGWGITLSLNHAHFLAETFDGPGKEDSQIAFERIAGKFSYDYYEGAAGEDAARSALWQGKQPADPDRYGFYVSTLQPATQRDPHVFRAVYRRLNLLDDINDIFTNEEILGRARDAVKSIPPGTTTADEVMAYLSEAEASVGRLAVASA